jgi:hypothetical protein
MGWMSGWANEEASQCQNSMQHLLCSRDHIPSPGYSHDEKKWKQVTLLTVIKIFIGCASPFFAETGKWNLISGKNLWFWDWDQKIVANSARQHTEPVSELQFRQKRQHWETNHQIRENF